VRSGIDVNDVELRSVAIGVGAPLRRDPQRALTAKTARASVLELAGSCIVDCAARYRPADVDGNARRSQGSRPGSSPSLRR
jgi:hypothetical protein